MIDLIIICSAISAAYFLGRFRTKKNLEKIEKRIDDLRAEVKKHKPVNYKEGDWITTYKENVP